MMQCVQHSIILNCPILLLHTYYSGESLSYRDDHSPEVVEIEENQYTSIYNIHIAITCSTILQVASSAWSRPKNDHMCHINSPIPSSSPAFQSHSVTRAWEWGLHIHTMPCIHKLTPLRGGTLKQKGDSVYVHWEQTLTTHNLHITSCMLAIAHGPLRSW